MSANALDEWKLTDRDFNSTDFENKFVCGEIMSYTDLKENGSEAAVKAAGKLKQQGKTYESTSPTLALASAHLLSWYSVIFQYLTDGQMLQ